MSADDRHPTMTPEIALRDPVLRAALLSPAVERRLGEHTVLRLHLDECSIDVRPTLSDQALTITVLLVRRGCVLLSSPDDASSVYRISAGQAAYLAGWRSYTAIWEHDTEVIAVESPVDTVRSVGVRIDDTGCRVIAPGMFGPASAFFESLIATDSHSPIVAYSLTQFTHEMVGSLFLESFGVDHEGTGSGAALFQQARALILARRSDPEFDAASLAEALCVSARKLQSVFRVQGTTVAGDLRARRAALAADLLADNAFAPLTVADIASYAGFRSAAAMRGALKAQGLASPADLRRAAAAFAAAT